MSFEIKDGVLERYCEEAGLKSIAIPEGVKSIGNWAFAYCSALESIVIPASVTSIGARAFAYCSALERIELPESVTYVGDYAFYECSSLPGGVTMRTKN